jgi:HlyD family secretion protein
VNAPNANSKANRLGLRGRTPSQLLAAAAVALLIAGAAYWLWCRASEPKATGYQMEQVDRGPIDVVVTATGTVNPVTTVTVGSYVSGPIRELFADFNSPVTQGQLVAKIDPRPFQVKVQQSEAGLANAKAKVEKSRADLAFKQLTYERNETLRKRNLVAQNDLDTARSDFAQARAQLALDEAAVRQADAEVAEARLNLGYTDITSPVEGVVISRSVEVGQTVAASFQTPELFKIAQDLTKMQVDASVSESDIGGVHEGQSVKFTVDAYPGRSFEGRVVQVRNSPVTVQNVVTYDVVIEVANPDLALKPGMTATVAVTTAHRDDVVRVPLRALRFRPDDAAAGAAAGIPPNSPIGTAVYVQDENGALQKVEIQTGLRNDRYAEVSSGDLQPGRDVVVALARVAEKTSAPSSGSPFMPKRVR